MRNYLDLVEQVLATGSERDDRTGTGCRSLFGPQLRFDLKAGFPLVTTKKVYWKGVVAELLWFISGSTRVKDLAPCAQKWWTPWLAGDDDLGPIYGQQLRRSRYWFEAEKKVFPRPEPERNDSWFCQVGDLQNVKQTHCNDSLDYALKSTWRDMIKRCYDPLSTGYAHYGAKGVHVEQSWLKYPNFKADVQRIEGWWLKLTFPDKYSLDKDILFASNRYGKDTCLWANTREQHLNTSTGTPFTAEDSETGTTHTFAGIGDMVELVKVNPSAVYRCLHGKLKTHHGWRNFKYIPQLLRFREYDQLANIIALLKHDSTSRRMVMNLWHTPAMTLAKLPCCHGSIIQFYADRGQLSCHVYQRSADMFIGVPVNMASYGLLTHMIALVCGMQAKDLIMTFGDCHLYNNHVDQVVQQLSRDTRPLPSLHLDPTVKNIDDFRMEHITLEGYDPWPAIKGAVAV